VFINKRNLNGTTHEERWRFAAFLIQEQTSRERKKITIPQHVKPRRNKDAPTLKKNNAITAKAQTARLSALLLFFLVSDVKVGYFVAVSLSCFLFYFLCRSTDASFFFFLCVVCAAMLQWFRSHH
jgi:hypothetical protein